MASPALLTLTPAGAELTIRLRGLVDDRVVDQLCDLIRDFLARGGTVDDVVVDLRATTHCSSSALECLASLVGAGMRLVDIRSNRPAPHHAPGRVAHEPRAMES